MKNLSFINSASIRGSNNLSLSSFRLLVFILTITGIQQSYAAGLRLQNCDKNWIFACLFDPSDKELQKPLEYGKVQSKERKFFSCQTGICKIFVINNVELEVDNTTATVQSHLDNGKTSANDLCAAIAQKIDSHYKTNAITSVTFLGSEFAKGDSACR